MSYRRISVLFIVAAVFLALLGVETLAERESYGGEAEVEPEIAVSIYPNPTVEEELQRLNSKIAYLESTAEDRVQELKTKDGMIAQLEAIAREKSSNLALLQSEIDSLQSKEATDAEERVGKVHAQAAELKTQVEILKSKIDLQNQQQQSVEALTKEAEKKAKELTVKTGKLQKLIEEQRNQIHTLEEAFQLTEEKIIKIQKHAESKARELSEAKNAWLPHWIVVQSLEIQSFAVKHWKDHGKPLWDVASQKAQVNAAKIHGLAKPYIEEINSKWVPVLQEKWVTACMTVQPRLRTAAAKLVEVYEESKASITPHVVKVKELAEPHLKELRKISKPYVDQVATITKPHVDTVRILVKPYTDRGVHVYRKFLKSATIYHHQVQSSVRRTLKEHEWTRALATDESVWFMASALLALPLFIIYNFCSSLFCKKGHAVPNGRSSHTRRQKRRHREVESSELEGRGHTHVEDLNQLVVVDSST